MNGVLTVKKKCNSPPPADGALGVPNAQDRLCSEQFWDIPIRTRLLWCVCLSGLLPGLNGDSSSIPEERMDSASPKTTPTDTDTDLSIWTLRQNHGGAVGHLWRCSSKNLSFLLTRSGSAAAAVHMNVMSRLVLGHAELTRSAQKMNRNLWTNFFFCFSDPENCVSLWGFWETSSGSQESASAVLISGSVAATVRGEQTLLTR